MDLTMVPRCIHLQMPYHNRLLALVVTQTTQHVPSDLAAAAAAAALLCGSQCGSTWTFRQPSLLQWFQNNSGSLRVVFQLLRTCGSALLWDNTQCQRRTHDAHALAFICSLLTVPKQLARAATNPAREQL